MTVTGVSRPISSKIWVIPVFLPISPIILTPSVERFGFASGFT